MTIDDLKVGQRVKSNLTSRYTTRKWFSGTIHCVDPYSLISEISIDICRDDGVQGGGRDLTWHTIVNTKTFKGIELLVGDWDE